MIRYSQFLLLSTVIAALLPGCAAMTVMKSTASDAMSSFRPGNRDYDDPTTDSSDPWVQEVGVEARGHQKKDKDGDPAWLRNLLTSQKARDIESNLGIE